MRSAEQKLLNAVQRPEEAYREVVVRSAGTRIVLPVWDSEHRPAQGAARPRKGGTAMTATSSHWWPRLVARMGHLIDRLYRWRLGWLFAHRFAVLTHVGRRSGKTYRTALWVYRYQPETSTITFLSVWGESDWYRNIRKTPATLIQIGRSSIVPGRQQFLCTDDIVAIEKEYRREHPWIARGQALLMHWPWPATDVQLKTMCEHMRAVTFSPAP